MGSTQPRRRFWRMLLGPSGIEIGLEALEDSPVVFEVDDLLEAPSVSLEELLLRFILSSNRDLSMEPSSPGAVTRAGLLSRDTGGTGVWSRDTRDWSRETGVVTRDTGVILLCSVSVLWRASVIGSWGAGIRGW